MTMKKIKRIKNLNIATSVSYVEMDKGATLICLNRGQKYKVI